MRNIMFLNKVFLVGMICVSVGYGNILTVKVITARLSYTDTLFVEKTNWDNYTFNLSSCDIDSVRAIEFSVIYSGKDTQCTMIDSITMAGAGNKLLIEDFEKYPLDINPVLFTADTGRFWDLIIGMNFTSINAIVVNDIDKCLALKYSNLMNGDVIFRLTLSFGKKNGMQPVYAYQDWSSYGTLVIRAKNKILTTGITHQTGMPAMNNTFIVQNGRNNAIILSLPSTRSHATVTFYDLFGKLLGAIPDVMTDKVTWQAKGFAQKKYVVRIQ